MPTNRLSPDRARAAAILRQAQQPERDHAEFHDDLSGEAHQRRRRWTGSTRTSATRPGCSSATSGRSGNRQRQRHPVQRGPDSVHHRQLHRRLHAHPEAEPGQRFPHRPPGDQHGLGELFLRERHSPMPGPSWGSPASMRTARARIRALRNSTSADFPAGAIPAPTGSRLDHTWQASEQISWTLRNHSIMAGAGIPEAVYLAQRRQQPARRIQLQRPVLGICAGRFHAGAGPEPGHSHHAVSRATWPRGAMDSSCWTTGRLPRS